ncbi:type II toxin-antitoxin system prevent-host-death family antitoxin [Pseudomonas sp. App30]|uniref:type II toxin-antitoxin system Phd/YefM family antitoxin n=1 Tax=Pseudomonas sp. App30 TaxID=3068990 RepID=UPI003A80AB93
MPLHNIHDAKKYLSRLLRQVAAGEIITITKAGKPIAKIIPYDAPPPDRIRRIGFIPDLVIPPGFDEMDATVADLF